jgi:enoyl-CoA hydratase/carnithine racemase
LFRPVRALPLNIARELMLTGDPLEAERAHALGFVNRLTEPGQAFEAALALAERIVRNGPVAIDQSLAVTQTLTGADDITAWALTDAATATIMRSADALEGRNAFVEKREPRWSGK